MEIKDDNHEKALNLALNRISGEWNYDELNNLLDELAEFDLDSITGFDYNLDEIDYEFIPLDDDFVDDEEDMLIEEIDEDTDFEELAETVTETINTKSIPKDTIYKNYNNIIYYGEANDENIKKLLQEKQDTKEYRIKELKPVKTIQTPINYYITDNEEVIKKILEDTQTHRIR